MAADLRLGQHRQQRPLLHLLRARPPAAITRGSAGTVGGMAALNCGGQPPIEGRAGDAVPAAASSVVIDVFAGGWGRSPRKRTIRRAMASARSSSVSGGEVKSRNPVPSGGFSDEVAEVVEFVAGGRRCGHRSLLLDLYAPGLGSDPSGRCRSARRSADLEEDERQHVGVDRLRRPYRDPNEDSGARRRYLAPTWEEAGTCAALVAEWGRPLAILCRDLA